MKAVMGTGRSVEMNEFLRLKEGQKPSLGGVWEGREIRGSATIGEARLRVSEV